MSDIFRTFAAANVKRKFAILIAMVLLVGCRDNADIPNDPVGVYGEDAVYRSGDSTLYLCRHEWNSILLSETDPSDLVANLPWRVPTKEEGQLLHKYQIATNTQQRNLCVDEEGQYWTFLFGQGNVTKAGQKTRYTLRPVRLQVTPPDTIIAL